MKMNHNGNIPSWLGVLFMVASLVNGEWCVCVRHRCLFCGEGSTDREIKSVCVGRSDLRGIAN